VRRTALCRQAYSGSLAIIQDTIKTRSRTSVDFFYLEKIDGKAIDNSLGATIQANSGRGMKWSRA